MQIYNEKDQPDQRKVQNEQFRREEAQWILIKPSLVLKEIKCWKERLILKGEK